MLQSDELTQDELDALPLTEFPAKLKILFEKSRYKVLYGGRGGAKSWGVARALLIIGSKKVIRVLCAREFQNSIGQSVHKLLSDQITAMKLLDHYQITNNQIRGKNGTEFNFVGLKNNTTNIKSYEGCTHVWVEEAQSVSKRSWDILIPTIRAEGSEIWITFNPELETDETYQRFVINPPEDCLVSKINYTDNPWFPSVLELEKEALKNRDPEAYMNVWEGLCRHTVDGAIFAKEMNAAEMDGRITNVPYEASKPVHAIFDIGWADSTSVWLLQFVGMETRLIRYYETNQTTITEILAKLQTFGYVYDTLWLPHDAQNKTIQGHGKSIEDTVRQAGYHVRIIEKAPIADTINAARTMFNKCYFDRHNCSDGLQCLRHYRYEVDPDTGAFSQRPLHDQYSHGADAFRYIGMMVQEKKVVKRKPVNYDMGSWMA